MGGLVIFSNAGRRFILGGGGGGEKSKESFRSILVNNFNGKKQLI